MLEGFCEGVVLGRKAGVSLETILEVVMASGFASPYYNFKGAAIAKRDFETHLSVDLLVKDQNLMLEEAHALASSIEERIRRERPEIGEIVVHTEP